MINSEIRLAVLSVQVKIAIITMKVTLAPVKKIK